MDLCGAMGESKSPSDLKFKGPARPPTKLLITDDRILYVKAVKQYSHVRETILLIGAGFTQPFGGYLAGQMVSQIFNHPELDQHPEIRTRIRKNLDYEAVYSSVMRSKKYSLQAKDSLSNAVYAAYEQMLEAIFQVNAADRLQNAVGACKAIIPLFAGSETKQRGFVFSLNQDLFAERFYSNADGQKMMEVPGVRPASGRWFNNTLSWPLRSDDLIDLPVQSKVEALREDFCSKVHFRLAYVKLHGSFGWTGKNGSRVMVIGLTKSKLIREEPLLRWDFDLFKQVLTVPRRRLVVVGYSFRDKHINQVIADGIRKQKLKLYVVCPMTQQQFKDYLYPVQGFNVKRQPFGAEIFEGLEGYHGGSLTELYNPSTWELTPEGRSFLRNAGLI